MAYLFAAFLIGGVAGLRRMTAPAAGMLGAAAGAFAGAEARSRLAGAFGRDLPAALIEDAVVVLGAFAIRGAVA